MLHAAAAHCCCFLSNQTFVLFPHLFPTLQKQPTYLAAPKKQAAMLVLKTKQQRKTLHILNKAHRCPVFLPSPWYADAVRLYLLGRDKSK